MSLILEIKRIQKEFDLIRPNFLKIRSVFNNNKYEVVQDDFRFTIGGNYGQSYVMIFDKNSKHLFTIMNDSHTKKNRSVIHNDGSVILIDQNPISHAGHHKIYFNRLLTKEKYFHHCINNNMPTYEHTLLAIKMKYELQRKNITYNINVPFIDVEKLKTLTLDVDYFLRTYSRELQREQSIF